MTTNSNEATAQYYDKIYSALRPEELTDAEISLINFITKPSSKILDLGGGTGRHSITLAKQGHNVTVVDSSKGMTDELKKKNHNVKIVNKNIFRFHITQRYDLIILMWNTFNEIATTKNDAKKLLTKLKKALNKEGKILINIDDSRKVEPSNFNFNVTKAVGNEKIDSTWVTFKYNKRTNTSVSKETIRYHLNGDLKDTKISYIKQRYWSLNEIEEIVNDIGLKISTKNINGIDEFYIILTD